MVTACSSTGEVETGAQSLAGFVPTPAVPVQVSVTVTPAEVGTLIELVGGLEADKRSTTVSSVKSWRERKRKRRIAIGQAPCTNNSGDAVMPRLRQGGAR